MKFTISGLTLAFAVSVTRAQPPVSNPSRDLPRPPYNHILLMCSSRGDTRASYEWGGFAWHERRNRSQGVLNAIAWAPFWSLASVTGMSPGVWTLVRLRSWVRRRWKGPGFCLGCGYDLRATPQRCPECGLVVKGA